jgi:hypothetical protein
VVKFYNGRGTAEQWIKEGKNALRWARLSCSPAADDAERCALPARLQGHGRDTHQLRTKGVAVRVRA